MGYWVSGKSGDFIARCGRTGMQWRLLVLPGARIRLEIAFVHPSDAPESCRQPTPIGLSSSTWQSCPKAYRQPHQWHPFLVQSCAKRSQTPDYQQWESRRYNYCWNSCVVGRGLERMGQWVDEYPVPQGEAEHTTGPWSLRK